MFVNQGLVTRTNLARGSQTNADRNCEFCTAAGAVCLTPGAPKQTSRDAASYAGLSDSQPAGNYTEQAQRIVNFVTAKTGRRWGASASAFTEKPYDEAFTFMQRMHDKTAFAVYVSGPTKMDTVTQQIVTNKSHWLNALKVGSDIVYFDFQTNREYTGGGLAGKSQQDLQPVGGQNPSSSKLPFVGILSQSYGTNSDDEKTQMNRALHSSDFNLQKGVIDTSSAKMLAIAFFPGPH